MKRAFLLAAVVALGLSVGVVVAQDKPADKPAEKAPTSAPSTQASVPVNKKCPISGDAVDPTVKTVVYQGKTVGFCCEDCVEPFKKNPEKYMKTLK